MAPSILNVECVSGIYRILNKINGKFYIGSSVNIRWRVHKHLSHLRRGIHNNAYLQSAFTKYGEQAFVVDLVAECDRSDVLQVEQHYLDSLAPQYNICQFAANTLGYRHTAESKAKMAASNQGNQNGLGHRHSEATLKRLREVAAHRGPVSNATRAKLSAAAIGNKSNTGRKLPKDHVDKVAAASFQMWNGADALARREAASERAKARWADPEWKSQQAAKIKIGKAARLAAKGNHFGITKQKATELAQ